MRMSLLRLIVIGIPEQIALALLAFAIAKAEIEWKKVVFSGTLLACTAYFVRLIPITFGVHTIFIIMLLFFLVHYLGKADLIRSIISALIAILCLIFLEVISHKIIFALFPLSLEEVIKSEFLIIITGIPQDILLFTIAFIVKKYI